MFICCLSLYAVMALSLPLLRPPHPRYAEAKMCLSRAKNITANCSSKLSLYMHQTTENIHTESYLSKKSVRCFFDCVCKCVCKWSHRLKYTEGYLSEKSVRCFCDYCVCKWRVQMECTFVPPCS